MIVRHGRERPDRSLPLRGGGAHRGRHAHAVGAARGVPAAHRRDGRRGARVGVGRRGGRTEEARAGLRRGPLHGIPVAIKDIFHVAGMTTTCGAAPAFHTAATADATSVARLRAAGAVVLGKVHTTEVAYFEPGPTRNPWNTAHTPRGSSSGSPAAAGAP